VDQENQPVKRTLLEEGREGGKIVFSEASDLSRASLHGQ